jgi:hypothetical protein
MSNINVKNKSSTIKDVIKILCFLLTSVILLVSLASILSYTISTYKREFFFGTFLGFSGCFLAPSLLLYIVYTKSYDSIRSIPKIIFKSILLSIFLSFIYSPVYYFLKGLFDFTCLNCKEITKDILVYCIPYTFFCISIWMARLSEKDQKKK